MRTSVAQKVGPKGQVTFSPQSSGTHNATLKIGAVESSGPIVPFTSYHVNLSGAGG